MVQGLLGRFHLYKVNQLVKDKVILRLEKNVDFLVKPLHSLCTQEETIRFLMNIVWNAKPLIRTM